MVEEAEEEDDERRENLPAWFSCSRGGDGQGGDGVAGESGCWL